MSLKVLITEDDNISAKYLKDTLIQLGYDVVAIAKTAEESLELAQQISPDFVMMDINLPGKIDGIEATKRIRTLLNIPVIYLTNASDHLTLERALKTEPNGYVLKPFKKQELYTVIEMALYRDSLEKKLKANEQLMSLTLESIGDGLITTDEHGNITMLNKVAQNFIGCSINQILAKPINDFYIIKNEKDTNYINDFNTLINSINTNDNKDDFFLLSIDKSIIPINQTIAPIKDENNSIKGYIITFRDISVKKRAEEYLKRMNEELELRVAERTTELKSKNEELENEIEKRRIVEANLELALEKEKELSELKSRVVTTISHEFKTPLTSIHSSAEILEKYAQKEEISDKMKKHFTSIRYSAKTLSDMINDVLLIEKIDADKFDFNYERANLENFCAKLIEEFQVSVAKNHIVEFEHSNLPEESIIDQKLLRRILSNLLSNAVKYSNEGTNIKVKASYNNNMYEITVIDNGIGIPEEDQKHLFNLFHRGKNVVNFEGTGLGLSIIQKSVKLLGGTISLKSKIGKGTTFKVCFPKHTEEKN
ncbi:MAG: ATP-binding protein [Bacteroidota bacterium]